MSQNINMRKIIYKSKKLMMVPKVFYFFICITIQFYCLFILLLSQKKTLETILNLNIYNIYNFPYLKFDLRIGV